MAQIHNIKLLFTFEEKKQNESIARFTRLFFILVYLHRVNIILIIMDNNKQ